MVKRYTETQEKSIDGFGAIIEWELAFDETIGEVIAVKKRLKTAGETVRKNNIEFSGMSDLRDKLPKEIAHGFRRQLAGEAGDLEQLASTFRNAAGGIAP